MAKAALATLRAQLDRDYGDFSQPRHMQNGPEPEALIRDFLFDRFAPYLPPAPTGAALSIGLQNARETALVAQHFAAQTILNPAGRILEELLERDTAAQYVFGAPDKLAAFGRFDAVFSIHTFNFFEHPQAVLAAAKAVLNPGGKLFLAVQNATAGSRQLALAMGLIPHIHDIPAPLRQAGQIHFYDRAGLQTLAATAGFRLLTNGGVMLKTLTDGQMAALIRQNLVGEAYLRSLDVLGQQYPDLCASVYVVAEKD